MSRRLRGFIVRQSHARLKLLKAGQNFINAFDRSGAAQALVYDFCFELSDAMFAIGQFGENRFSLRTETRVLLEQEFHAALKSLKVIAVLSSVATFALGHILCCGSVLPSPCSHEIRLHDSTEMGVKIYAQADAYVRDETHSLRSQIMF